jgi:hypothetical protein
MGLHYRQLTNPRKETPCRIEPPFSLLQLRLPQRLPEFRKPHPSRRFLQVSRPMPVISLRFIIIGIITDTTGITIIITTGITIIIVIIATSDLALPTRGAYGANSLLLQFGQLKFVEKTMQRLDLIRGRRMSGPCQITG